MLFFALASVLLLSATAYPASAAQSVNVTMSDTSYLPQVITINVGDTVVWNNTGTVVHTATANGGQAQSWDSGDLNPHQTYAHTFTVAGNFSYYCIYHPDMVGTVVVQTPVPEFPGMIAIATVGLAVLLGLAAERSLRLRR
jgi:plastocyanin